MASLWLGLAQGFAAEPSNTTRFGLIAGMPPVLEGDAQKNDSETPIVAPLDYFHEGDEFLIKNTAALSGPEAWVKVVHEWIEPITAPDGTFPKVAADQMILVEIQGTVSLVEPGKAPVVATEGQELPSGATVVTEANSTVAVFIGGINSIRLGAATRVSLTYQVVGPFRLPGSTKSMQRRITRVKLEEGKVFSKIGYEPQVEQYFQISTTQASAVASAGDFLVIQEKDRFDIGVARGVVRVVNVAGEDIATLTANNHNGFQMLHNPAVKGHLAAMSANSRFLEATLALIRQANRKVGALRQRHQQGQDLTRQEREYMDRLPTITFLQRVRKL